MTARSFEDRAPDLDGPDGEMSEKNRRKRGRPRASVAAETRVRILNAARSCFAAYGYSDASNKQIADEAGLTSAAIYNHFESKSQLFAATVADAQRDFMETYRRAIGERQGLAALDAILAVSPRINANDPALARFFAIVPIEMQRHPEVAAAVGEVPLEVVDLIERLVAEARRNGEIAREIPASAVVSMLLSFTSGLALYGSAAGPQAHRAAIQAFRRLVKGSLTTAGAGA